MSNMLIEKFTGTTLEAAIESINQKWGPDATILHVEKQTTRSNLLSPSRQWVEVSARAPEPRVKVDSYDSPPSESQPETVSEENPTTKSDSGLAQEIHSLRKEITGVGASVRQMENSNWASSEGGKRALQHPLMDLLIDRGINSEDALELIADWSMKNPNLDLPDCMADLDRRIPRLGWKEIFPQGKSRCTLFMGLPGSGKTLLLIKIAARLKLVQKADVLIVSADVSRAGPSHELALYSEILQVPVVQAFDLKELKTVIQDAKTDTHILVDWNGISPYDHASWKPLELFKTSHPNAQILLTASLVSDLQMWRRLQNQFEDLPLVGLALTQADLECRLGKVWEGVRGTNLPLAFISTGKNVPGDLCEGTGFPFAKLLFKGWQPGRPQKLATEAHA